MGRVIIACAAALMWGAGAHAQTTDGRSAPAAAFADHPPPPPRPAETPPQQGSQPVAPHSAAEPPLEPAPDAACLAALTDHGLDAVSAPQSQAGEACVIDTPVTVRAVRLRDGSSVALGGALMRCSLALDIARWVRDDLAPIAEKHGARLTALVGVSGHACRARNGLGQGRMSEHASGNALDLRALKFADGRTVELMKAGEGRDNALREDVRASACAAFRTALGAGSDSFHDDHLHVDQRERRGGARLCQWDIR